MEAIPVSDVIIVHGDFHTTMGHGLLAFNSEQSAKSFADEVDGEILTWNDLRLEYEFPDWEFTLDNNAGDGSDTYKVNRGDIISITFKNPEKENTRIRLQGYDFAMDIPGNSKTTELFVADKPGQGFVFRKNDKEILATLFVEGDHTAEEAIYR